MTRFFVAVLMLVVAALLVAFAIANRTWSPSPSIRSTPRAPAYVVTLPLYILGFIDPDPGRRGRRHRRLVHPGQAPPLSPPARVASSCACAPSSIARVREKATQEAALRGMRATATTAPARLPAN